MSNQQIFTMVKNHYTVRPQIKVDTLQIRSNSNSYFLPLYQFGDRVYVRLKDFVTSMTICFDEINGQGENVRRTNVKINENILSRATITDQHKNVLKVKSIDGVSCLHLPGTSENIVEACKAFTIDLLPVLKDCINGKE